LQVLIAARIKTPLPAIPNSVLPWRNAQPREQRSRAYDRQFCDNQKLSPFEHFNEKATA
jgi:hypothetical protein